jgi:putative hemolysin
MDALADVFPYLLTALVLLVASAFFSGTEVAMFSLRRVEREQMARSRRRSDQLVHALVSHPRRLIATILIGNEVVNVSISSVMATVGERVLSGSSELAVAMLATAMALPLLLALGEITPKTIAIKTAAAWSRAAARPLWLFGSLVTPVRWVVHGLANLVLRLFGVGAKSAGPRAMGEDEFKALVDVGTTEGQVDVRERRLIHRVFEFGDKNVAAVAVPADQCFLLAYNLPLSRILGEVRQRGLSRVPIYHKSPDNILGILYAKDLVLLGTGASAPRRLGELLHEPLFVPRNMRLAKLFDIFKERKIHMAIVVNEYGKFAGLVTMEDVLEELVGPIRDEKEVRQRSQPVPLPNAAEESS